MKKKEAKGSLVKRKQISEAVKALKAYTEKWYEQNPSRKKSLLAEPCQTPVLLNFTLKKIPELSNIKMIKVPLPHSLVTDVTEVCLITGDLDKRDTKADIEPTVQHYKELLSKHGVTTISEVIPLRQLRTEYKQHEAKRNLYGAYDYFLSDNRIAQCLPRILGRFFFKKRKFPQQINLATSNLKSQIENALSRTVFFLTGRGNSCSTEVAHLGFTTKQIVENIEAAINILAANIPGTWKNINALYVKTPLSISIPFYISSESGNDVELPVPETVEDVEAEEITTLRSYKVKVCSDGNIELIKKEQPSSDEESDHESEESSSEETDSSDEDYYGHKPRKIQKKRKMSSVLFADDDEEGTECLSRRKEELKEAETAKTKSKEMVSDVSDGRDADIDEEETETLSRRKAKLKKEAKTAKTKSKKKEMVSGVSDDSDADIDEETETLSRRKAKLKKEAKTEKTKSKEKEIVSDADIDEEETESLSKRKMKLKKEAKMEKTKSKKKEMVSDAGINKGETESLSRRKMKLKKEAKTEKTKSKKKEMPSDADINEEAETLSRRKEKLKKKANMEKTKSVVKKKKKRSMDEISDDEIVKTKKKKKNI